MRYNLMGNAGHWFPGANAAAFDSAAIRAALDGYPFADRIPSILAEAHALLHGEEQKRAQPVRLRRADQPARLIRNP